MLLLLFAFARLVTAVCYLMLRHRDRTPSLAQVCSDSCDLFRADVSVSR